MVSTATTHGSQRPGNGSGLGTFYLIAQNDIPPDRLARARYKIIDYLGHRHEGLTGLLAFSNESFVVSPLTEDADTIRELVPVLEPDIMPSQGHNIAEALQKAELLFEQAGLRRGNIVLITDHEATGDDIRTAKSLAQKGFFTSVLALAPPTQNPAQTLTLLAQKGEGVLAPFTNDDTDIKTLRMAETRSSDGHRKTHETALLWKDHGRWFIVFALPFIALGFRRGWFDAWLH